MDELWSKVGKYLYESAFLISVLFFIGYGYTTSFLERLSVPTEFIGIQKIDYMTAALGPILLFGIIFAFFFYIWSYKPINKWKALLGNAFFFIVAIIYTLFSIKIEKQLILFLCIILIVILAYFTIKIVSISNYIYNLNGSFKIVFLLSMILIFFNVACFLGIYNAENYIQGKGDVKEIQLSLINKSNTQLQNKTLILVIMHDNNYYVIEKNETIPKNPKLYIIPSNQIEMATIYKSK